MTVTTDYDAPRRSILEDVDPESLDALTAAATTASRSPDVDLEEDDTAEGIDLPGADLSGEVLTMPVILQQADEFTCTSCSWCSTAAGSPATAPDGRSAWTAHDPAGGASRQQAAGDRGSRVWRGRRSPVTSRVGNDERVGNHESMVGDSVFGPIGVSRPRACQQMMARHRPGERAGPTTSVVRYSRASVGSTPCTGARSPGPGRRIVVVGTATTPTPRQSHRASHQQPGSDRPNCAATGTSSPMAQPSPRLSTRHPGATPSACARTGSVSTGW